VRGPSVPGLLTSSGHPEILELHRFGFDAADHVTE
jgi:hypothetical protein